jgi:hypothetical protein
MKLKIFFFANFQILGPLWVSGMGCYTSKCEKSQNHCTLLYILELYGEKPLSGQQSLHSINSYHPRLAEKSYLRTPLCNLLELALLTT